MIGNPPFVQYQDFSGEARARSRAAALRAGVPLTNLVSSWAAFAVHSAQVGRGADSMSLDLGVDHCPRVRWVVEVALLRTSCRSRCDRCGVTSQPRRCCLLARRNTSATVGELIDVRGVRDSYRAHFVIT